jgi:hypothetical protein
VYNDNRIRVLYIRSTSLIYGLCILVLINVCKYDSMCVLWQSVAIQEVAAGGAHSGCVSADGRLYTFGAGSHGAPLVHHKHQ